MDLFHQNNGILHLSTLYYQVHVADANMFENQLKTYRMQFIMTCSNIRHAGLSMTGDRIGCNIVEQCLYPGITESIIAQLINKAGTIVNLIVNVHLYVPLSLLLFSHVVVYFKTIFLDDTSKHSNSENVSDCSCT